MLDYWAHRHCDDPNLRNEDVNPDFDADLAEMEALEGIPSEPLTLPDSDFEAIVSDEFGG